MVLSAFSGKRLWVDAENGARLVTASGAPKTRKGRCSAPVVAWALCLALAAFNVYYTWCLHARIGALEAGVEARTADALLEKSDSPFSSGIVGQPTSADEDQEEATEEQPDALAGLLASLDGAEEDAKVEYDYDEQHVASEDDEEEDAEEDDDDGDDAGARRHKRQVDLTSHTQDGVPIFDQGYGVATNRTEGLRIYQSLLANGRAEQRATDAPPVLPHHRENSFWRGRSKDKSRHHHQYGKLSAQPTVELDEPETEARNRTRGRPSSSSVEFRSSRVKPSSSEGAGSISSSKTWPRPAGSSVTLGGSPFASDERVSAATAPAVLTKSASAVSAAAAGRSRSQHSVFRVTQPSSAPPLSPTPVPADAREEPAGRAAPPKKRVNKKQLRDLSHVASAVHLVADTRNATGTDNQVEIASRNELGLHTSWKMAGAGDEPHKTPLVKIDGAILTVKQSGLYFIYSQVHYLDEHGVNAYEVFVNTEPFLRCVTSAAPETTAPKPNTCYTAGASVLREGDKLFLRDIEPLRYSVLQPSKTFFGLIRLAPVSE